MLNSVRAKFALRLVMIAVITAFLPLSAWAGYGSTSYGGIGNPMGVGSGSGGGPFIQLDGGNTPTTGDINIGLRLNMPTLINNVGFKLPTNPGDCSLLAITGVQEGDTCWDTTNDVLYIYDGASFVAVGFATGPYLLLDTSNDPLTGDLVTGTLAAPHDNTIHGGFPAGVRENDPALNLEGYLYIDGAQSYADATQPFIWIDGNKTFTQNAKRMVLFNAALQGNDHTFMEILHDSQIQVVAPFGINSRNTSYKTDLDLSVTGDTGGTTDLHEVAAFEVTITTPHLAGTCNVVTPGSDDICYYYGMLVPFSEVSGTGIYLRDTFHATGGNNIGVVDTLFRFGTDLVAFDTDDHLVSYAVNDVEKAYIRTDGGAYFDGPVHIAGKLTVDGAIDPPSLSLSGGTALFLDSADGSTAPVSAANHGRIRYLDGTGWQMSASGGAYATIATTASVPVNAFVQGGNTFGATAVLGTNDLQNLALETDNTTRLTLSTASLTSTLPFRGANGSSVDPQYSFSGDTDSGVYSAGANSIGISAGTVGALVVNTTSVQPTVQVQSTIAGSVSAPNFSNSAATSTGLYFVPASNDVGVSQNGASVWTYSGSPFFNHIWRTPNYAYTSTANTHFQFIAGDVTNLPAGNVGTVFQVTPGTRTWSAGAPDVVSVDLGLLTMNSATGSSTATSATGFFARSPFLDTNISTTKKFAARFGTSYSSGDGTPDGRLQTVGPIEASTTSTLTAWTSSALLLQLTGGGINTSSTTERPYVDFNFTSAGTNTQFTAATIATQRTVKIQPPTYTFSAAGTMTNAATVGITGAPRQSTNATLTSTHGLYLEGNAVNAVGTPTNASMFTIASAPTGATNNYSMWVQAGSSRFDSTLALQNTTGTASELRLYEPSGSGTNYTSFTAGAQAADAAYTLPPALPTVNGQVLSGTTGGVLSWATPAAGTITAVGSMTSGAVFASAAASGQWHGLGAGAGRLSYTDAATDQVNIEDAILNVGTSAACAGPPAGCGSASVYAFGGYVVSEVNNYASVRAYSHGTGVFATNAMFSSRGTTAAPTASQANDYVAGLQMGGHDGVQAYGRANIYSQVTQTWSAGNHGQNMWFSTTANNTPDDVQRLMIDQNGNVGIGPDTTPDTLLDVQGTFSAGTNGEMSVTTSGDTTVQDLAVNGGDFTTSVTSFNLLNATATTINFGGAVASGGINFAGGLGATGCKIDGGVGNLECDAQLISEQGTASEPGHSFTGDTDTGIYRAAANTLGFSTSGTTRGNIDTEKMGMLIPLAPLRSVAATITAPFACDSTHEGFFFYARDSDGAGTGGNCICQGTSPGGTFAWASMDGVNPTSVVCSSL